MGEKPLGFAIHDLRLWIFSVALCGLCGEDRCQFRVVSSQFGPCAAEDELDGVRSIFPDRLRVLSPAVKRT